MKQEILYLEQIVTDSHPDRIWSMFPCPFERVKYWVLRVSAKAVPLYWRMYCAASYARLRARSIWMAFRSATVRRTKPASWEFTRLPIRLP